MVPENPGRFERRPLFLEVDQTEHPVRDTIFSRAHEVIDGKLHFNDLPGLGVDIDESAMEPFVVDLGMND